MKRRNLFPALAAALLVALPLWLVPAADDAFEGTDAKAQAAVRALAPDYRPWAEPLFVPPGGEVESLLFALQAALGAGFLGFWLGCAVTRERLKRPPAPDEGRTPGC